MFLPESNGNSAPNHGQTLGLTLQTGETFCLILSVRVSLGSVLIEQTEGGAGCFVVMLGVRLDESGVFLIRVKINVSA